MIMIKNLKHAQTVQIRRINKRKHGYAKAVRRFLLRNNGENFVEYKAQLPVAWPYRNNTGD